MNRLLPLEILLLLGMVGAPSIASADEPSPRVLHLDDAVRIAHDHQPSVLNARALTNAAAGRITEARAAYLPQVTGTALAERVHSRSVSSTSATSPTTGTAGAGTTGTTGIGGSGAIPTYDVFSVGLNASQLIWDFGTTINRTRAATAGRDAQEAAEHTTELQIALQVRRAFFQAHAQHALVKVGEESVQNFERHLGQITGFVEQGIRPEIDLAQARTDLANSKVTLINARNGYSIAKAQLNQAMGVVGPTDYDVADEDIGVLPGEDGPSTDLAKTALDTRPEIVTLRRQQRAAQLTLTAVKGAYGPTLSAVGAISEAGVQLDALGTNWNVGLVLSWPLFQGGLTTGQVREAQGNLDAAGAQIAQEELAVRLEVEQGLLDVQSAKVVISAAREALTNAKEQLRLAEGRYESGVGSIIELGDAQVAAANAAAQDVQAEYSLASARAELLSALGR